MQMQVVVEARVRYYVYDGRIYIKLKISVDLRKILKRLWCWQGRCSRVMFKLAVGIGLGVEAEPRPGGLS
jgi:hypothetical protein